MIFGGFWRFWEGKRGLDEQLISIGLVRNVLRFFRKFPGTAENVLEYSILGVYIDGMSTVRMTIKLSKWKLSSN